ncbi:hypothetical protein HJFPF1_08593 [Paramyrothecium foliicola]|nr:hypothetical protein HJFPF1_08593 [Paramyrothecium foliicola]
MERPNHTESTSSSFTMKFSLVAIAALLSIASAQQAVVINDCKKTVYVQSFPYNGGQPGPLTTLKPGESFSENFRGSGSTVKIARTKTFDSPLFFGYSFSKNPDYAYYAGVVVEENSQRLVCNGCRQADKAAGTEKNCSCQIQLSKLFQQLPDLLVLFVRCVRPGFGLGSAKIGKLTTFTFAVHRILGAALSLLIL